jgi:hypothetical protein
MRKFTFSDVRDWKVVDVYGKELVLTVVDKDGKVRNITRFDGYRSASRAASRLGGQAVRV